MIDNKTIDAIYKKYNNRPESLDELNIPLLFEAAHDDHSIEIKGHDIIINSLDQWSPFHAIDLHRVHAILDFDRYVAVVLHSSIIFIGKHNNEIHIHVKEVKPSITDRMRNLFCACI